MAVVPVGAADGPLRRQVRPATSRPRSRSSRRACPSRSREHVERTLDGLSKAPRRRRRSTRHVRQLTRAWAERRVVTHRLRAGARTRAERRAPPGDGPAVPARAVAPDPRAVPDRLRRGRATRMRTFKIERIRDLRADAADLRAARAARPRARRCGGPGTSSRTSRRPRSCCASRPRSRARVREATWHPTPAGRERRRTARSSWRATRRGHDRDPALDPVVGRRGRGHRAAGAARGRRRDPGAGARTVPVTRSARTGNLGRRQALTMRRPTG